MADEEFKSDVDYSLDFSKFARPEGLTYGGVSAASPRSRDTGDFWANLWQNGQNWVANHPEKLLFGGLGAAASIWDAYQRNKPNSAQNKYVRQQNEYFKQQLARQQAADAVNAKYSDPLDVQLAMSQASPEEFANTGLAFRNNGLKFNTVRGVPLTRVVGYADGGEVDEYDFGLADQPAAQQVAPLTIAAQQLPVAAPAAAAIFPNRVRRSSHPMLEIPMSLLNKTIATTPDTHGTNLRSSRRLFASLFPSTVIQPVETPQLTMRGRRPRPSILPNGLAEGGFLSGGTSGQSDKIPAMLSDGEFVMDAETVSALGDGNNAAGASALEQMRQNIRKHKRAAPAHKIPPKAKKPEQYLKKGKK